MGAAFSNFICEKNRTLIISIFFIGYLFLGLFLYKDYGVHWDELHNQTAGTRWMEYIQKVISGENQLGIEDVNKHDFIHGPLYELFLSFMVHKVLDLNSSRQVIFTRHLLTFLTFYVGVLFFYWLCRIFFENWKLALLACCFLILHPRIFSHTFYNSVDIPFLTFYIISMYTLLKVLEQKTPVRLFFHALTCAMLVDIRIAGLVVVQCTYIFMLSDTLLVEKGNYKGLIRNIVIFSLFLLFFTIFFWPYLWSNPVGNFLTALKLSKFKSIVYPHWSYNFIWIAVTTPLLYSFLFLFGLICSIYLFFRDPIKFYEKRRQIVVAILFFFLPIIIPIMYRTLLFDGWRHHYFVYPVFIVFSIFGLSRILMYIQTTAQGFKRQILNWGLVFVITISITPVLIFMIRHHPYQHVYGNFLSGKDMARAKFQNSLDYWGLSYRAALEYILENDNRNNIKIFSVNMPGHYNSMILKSSEKKRLHYVGEDQKADYFISNYRLTRIKYRYPDQKEYFSIVINGQNIIVVYKITG